ncbi:MAG: hypothetical protein ABIE84_04235, partial [bacterium]
MPSSVQNRIHHPAPVPPRQEEPRFSIRGMRRIPQPTVRQITLKIQTYLQTWEKEGTGLTLDLVLSAEAEAISPVSRSDALEAEEINNTRRKILNSGTQEDHSVYFDFLLNVVSLHQARGEHQEAIKLLEAIRSVTKITPPSGNGFQTQEDNWHVITLLGKSLGLDAERQWEKHGANGSLKQLRRAIDLFQKSRQSLKAYRAAGWIVEDSEIAEVISCERRARAA